MGLTAADGSLERDAMAVFIENLEPKLRDKLVRQIFYLSGTSPSELQEHPDFAVEYEENAVADRKYHTETAGYTSRAKTVTATKTIGPLDRNGMSYVPATTTQNGVTLNLSNVDWQIIGTDLVGDMLAPAS